MNLAAENARRHDRMVELVEQILAARKQPATAQDDLDFYTTHCDN